MMELGFVLLVLCLAEGLTWVPPGTVVYTRRPWGTVSATAVPARASPGKRRLILPSPWLPVFERFVAPPWPVALSPGGIEIPDPLGPGAPPGRPSLMPWHEIRSIRAAGPRILVRRESIADAGSPAAARHLVGLLGRIAAAAPDRRAALIREAIAMSCEARTARSRLRGLRILTREAGPLPWFLAINMVLYGPWIALFLGMQAAWIIWPAVHIVLTCLAVRIWIVAARRVPSIATAYRPESLIMICAFPPATARFLEPLFADAFCGLDPLAAAAALLCRPEFEREARARLRRLHPRDGDSAGVRWFLAEQRAAVESLIRREGLSPDRVCDPPPRDAGAVSFCPSCEAQYRIARSCCSDCQGTGLRLHPA